MKASSCLVAFIVIAIAAQSTNCTRKAPDNRPIVNRFHGKCADSAIAEIEKIAPKIRTHKLTAANCTQVTDSMIAAYEIAMKWAKQCNVQIGRVLEVSSFLSATGRAQGTCEYQGNNLSGVLGKINQFCDEQSIIHGEKDQCREIHTFNRCVNSFQYLKKVGTILKSTLNLVDLPAKRLPLICVQKDKECVSLAQKQAKKIESECRNRVDDIFAEENLKLFKCEDKRREATKYHGCGDLFNSVLGKFNFEFKCPTPVPGRRENYLGYWYYQIKNTLECTSGLKGYWNSGKFGKKELTASEKIEAKVMSASNNCLRAFAQRNLYPTFVRRQTDKNGKLLPLPFDPRPSVKYTLCVQKILRNVAEEEEKLKSPVKFYPNYPNNVDKEYNLAAEKENNKQAVLKMLSDFETECKTSSTSGSSDKCEQAKIYNRCIARTSEASKYWNQIDNSISASLNTMDEAKECETANQTEEAD